MFKKLLLIFLFLSTTNFLYSQITISSPVVRQIFQRDLNNQATVTITGSYSQPIDTIQVRFTPVKANQGTAIDWKVIKSAPLGGLFKGSITVKGGWYTMEVRGLLNGKVVGNVSTLERVGVGEVFVIAGQSNAGGSGLLETKETAAEDDRVNCANFISPRAYNPKGWEPFKFFQADLSQFSIIEFSQLKKTSAIGPMGLGPYYWGKVGDALSAKLNVPIMFFNTAWAGASLKTWRYSAENPTLQAPSDYFPDVRQFDYPKGGYPYVNLSTVLKYYGINLGVRAVLWMEGETHNLFNLEAIGRGEAPPTTVNSYLDDLRRLVKRTRQDLGNNKLAWVVARTSYSSERNCASSITPPAPSPIIVNAQNQAITDPTLAPIYPGPFTDNIQVSKIGEREQCVHFTGTGLDDVATSWIKTLTEDNKNFFETVEPILADTIPSVSLDCISSGVLKLSLPSGYTGYEWVNTGNNTIVGNTQSISVNSGSYVARVTRSNGNIVQVPEFTVKANTPPLAPSVKALSDVNFCLGTSVVLQGTSGTDNPIYEWVSSPVITNLPRTKDIAATREGTYKLRVVDKNACASPYSTEVKLVAKPRPEKPFVATSGNTALCQGQTLTLTSTNVGASSYLWSNGEKTQAITIRNAGTYNVQTVGTNGCLSPSSTDNIAVIVNSLPATPQIRALSDTVFCDGGNALLVLTPADNKLKLGWNRNNSISKDTVSTIRISSTELVKGFVVDTKGCQSLLSNAIQVVKKDNPMPVSVTQNGAFTLKATPVDSSNKKGFDKYIWKLNSKVIASEDTVTISTRKYGEGEYSVISKNIYKIRSSINGLSCISSESKAFNYSFQISENKGVNVYPNPSENGIFFIERLYSFNEADTFKIYSTTGELLYEKNFKNFILPQILDLSFLKSGNYILRSEKGGLSKKVIILLPK